jgi:prolyl-tRNA synthetase
VAPPGVKTIAELMQWFGMGEDRFLKTVAYEADGELVLAAVRGDFSISSTKLANHLKVVHLDLADEEALAEKALCGGFLSPIGTRKIRVVTDTSIQQGVGYVVGANEVDRHYRNAVPGRDFLVEDCVDIAEVREGDLCAQCRAGTLEIRRGIELGHTFKLGTKYTASDSMDVTYLDQSGEKQRVVMGCYGIGVERLMASAVEQWHDNAGIIWPMSLAPYQVVVTPLGRQPDVRDAALRIYGALQRSYQVLYDDRDESPGVKLKDADLLGIPVRVVISQKLITNAQAEIKVRKTGEVIITGHDQLERVLTGIIASLQPSLDGLPYMAEQD